MSAFYSSSTLFVLLILPDISPFCLKTRGNPNTFLSIKGVGEPGIFGLRLGVI